MIPAQHLTTSIQSHWAAETASQFETVYPGTRRDTQRLAEWCELGIENQSDPPRRNADPDRLAVSILVHCFSRHSTQPIRVQRLATVARSALSRRAVPIQDTTGSTPVELGCLRVREHAAHDLSRNHAALGQELLQHIVLVFQAVAEELSPTA
jgi:hypothetical protein